MFLVPQHSPWSPVINFTNHLLWELFQKASLFYMIYESNYVKKDPFKILFATVATKRVVHKIGTWYVHLFDPKP